MAKIYKEFDEPASAPKRFCKQIRPDMFEDNSPVTTKKALEDLMEHLNNNHQEAYRMIRAKEEKNMNFMDSMKAKFTKTFFNKNYLPDDQCQEELEKLERAIMSTFHYTQGLSLVTVTKSMD